MSDDRVHFIEPDGTNREAARQIGYRFIDLLIDTASRAAARPPLDRATGQAGGTYAPSLSGRDITELLEETAGLLQHGMNPSHPGYLGHMDSIASAAGSFSDALVSALNNNMLAYEMSPVWTTLERRLMDWACRLFGLDQGPTTPAGQMVSGGTLANMTALLVARNRHGGAARRALGLASSPERLVFLASENAHYSFQKAANLLGLGREGWVPVPTDARGRVQVDFMASAITALRREGRVPFCLVGVAGTTVTASLDPLAEIAALAREEGLWFHVDAAYGGSIALSEASGARLAGIEQADSITWNPQKWLFVPKTCATILFRDGAELEAGLREGFVYGNSNRAPGGEPAVNLGEYTLQGTRRVDALKLWITLEHLGVAEIGRHIEQNLSLARAFHRELAKHPEIEVQPEPDLNIVCFRYRGGRALDDPALDLINREIQERIEASGSAWLSLPHYHGRKWLRAVILHPRCTLEILRGVVEQVLHGGATGRP